MAASFATPLTELQHRTLDMAFNNAQSTRNDPLYASLRLFKDTLRHAAIYFQQNTVTCCLHSSPI